MCGTSNLEGVEYIYIGVTHESLNLSGYKRLFVIQASSITDNPPMGVKVNAIGAEKTQCSKGKSNRKVAGGGRPRGSSAL